MAIVSYDDFSNLPGADWSLLGATYYRYDQLGAKWRHTNAYKSPGGKILAYGGSILYLPPDGLWSNFSAAVRSVDIPTSISSGLSHQYEGSVRQTQVFCASTIYHDGSQWGAEAVAASIQYIIYLETDEPYQQKGPYDSEGNFVGGYGQNGHYDGYGAYDSGGNFVGGYDDTGQGDYYGYIIPEGTRTGFYYMRVDTYGASTVTTSATRSDSSALFTISRVGDTVTFSIAGTKYALSVPARPTGLTLNRAYIGTSSSVSIIDEVYLETGSYVAAWHGSGSFSPPSQLTVLAKGGVVTTPWSASTQFGTPSSQNVLPAYTVGAFSKSTALGTPKYIPAVIGQATAIGPGTQFQIPYCAYDQIGTTSGTKATAFGTHFTPLIAKSIGKNTAFGVGIGRWTTIAVPTGFKSTAFGTPKIPLTVFGSANNFARLGSPTSTWRKLGVTSGFRSTQIPTPVSSWDKTCVHAGFLTGNVGQPSSPFRAYPPISTKANLGAPSARYPQTGATTSAATVRSLGLPVSKYPKFGSVASLGQLTHFGSVRSPYVTQGSAASGAQVGSPASAWDKFASAGSANAGAHVGAAASVWDWITVASPANSGASLGQPAMPNTIASVATQTRLGTPGSKYNQIAEHGWGTATSRVGTPIAHTDNFAESVGEVTLFGTPTRFMLVGDITGIAEGINRRRLIGTPVRLQINQAASINGATILGAPLSRTGRTCLTSGIFSQALGHPACSARLESTTNGISSVFGAGTPSAKWPKRGDTFGFSSTMLGYPSKDIGFFKTAFIYSKQSSQMFIKRRGGQP